MKRGCTAKLHRGPVLVTQLGRAPQPSWRESPSPLLRCLPFLVSFGVVSRQSIHHCEGRNKQSHFLQKVSWVSVSQEDHVMFSVAFPSSGQVGR